MSTEIQFTVEKRERTGKGGAREARRNGLIPGVLYGGDRGAVPITLKFNEVIRA
ncbi:MAG: 50S ribosomal protein L25, partial [Pseudomonadota bacterium]